tara:strand:- start:328 stop:891 length:564 start_codon:yes stop_codon:yes gene_type:complete
MLGLGASINRSAIVESGPAPLYSKEVIESGDGFTASGNHGTYTLTYNQTAPNGVTGWMKLHMDTDQQNSGAGGSFTITNSSILSGSVGSSTTASISYDIYLHSAALWGSDDANDDDVIPIRTQLFTQSIVTNVPAETSTAVSGTKTSFFPYSVFTISVDTVTLTNKQDIPLAGAELYIKNLEIRIIS